MTKSLLPPVEIADVQAVKVSDTGDALVVAVDAKVGDQRTRLEFAITTELAPAVAIALLATTAKARAERDGLEPALEILAAAVVESGCAEKVRLQLLFDKGAVLPVEMSKAAGDALVAGLAAVDNGADTGSGQLPLV
jgi:hypothetical protein